MTDIYKDNLSAQSIIRSAIARSNRPLNKYNESMHQDTEAITGIPNDRTSADVGEEPLHREYPEFNNSNNEPY